MRSAVTVRKASAYLTSFDAARPANDSQDASDANATPMAETASCGESLATALDKTENTATDAAIPQSDVRNPEEITAAIEAKIVAAVEVERLAAEHRLLKAREDWTAEIADSLARRFEQAIAETFETFRNDVEGILRPFVSHEVFIRSIADVTENIKKGLVGVDAPAIEISAPADLIEKLSRSLADRDIAISARESDQLDVVVKLGSTTIATKLETWLAQLTAGRSEAL